MRKALIRESDGYVENVIVADDNFPAPEGRILVESDSAGPGDTWDGTDFVRPDPPPSPEDPVRVPQLSADELEQVRALLG